MRSKIMRAACALGVVTTVLVVASTEAPAAEAQGADKTSCADAYKNAQVQRKNGTLKRARESLLVCVSDRCPSMLQPDCTRWLTEVEAALPSVAFAAKGADGHDLSAVKVTVDGQVLTETLDGKSIPIDPGNHTLRFETLGETPIDQSVVVREGEKARVISVSWAKAPEQDQVAANGAAAPPSKPPVAAWVFGGIGVASLATFGVLAIHGTSRRSDLKSSCYGHCTDADVSSVKTEFAIGDVALGIGIVSAAVSGVLFLTNRSGAEHPPPTAKVTKPRILAVDVVPNKAGASFGLGGEF